MSTSAWPGAGMFIPGVVLDTNILSEFVRPQPNKGVVEFVTDTRNTLITAVSVAELRFGVARMPGGRRRNVVAGAMEHAIGAYSGRILPFDEHATKAFAEVMTVRAGAGRPIGVSDGMIAAICMCRTLTLATRNTKDFTGLPISLVDPWS